MWYISRIMKLKKERINISIIIIGYNDEKHYGNAILSAQNQTLKDIEIICVDDGSSDNTPSIINHYAKKDKRVVPLILEYNIGSFGARNEGLKKASGEFVMYLDSDDTIDEKACEISYNKIKEANADVVQFGTKIIVDKSIDGNDYQETIRFLEDYLDTSNSLPKFISKIELMNYSLIEKKYSWNIWGKLYAKKLLDNAYQYCKNERIKFSEDLLISFMIMHHSNKIVRCKEKLYQYTFGTGVSTSANNKLLENDKDIVDYVSQGVVYNLANKWLKEEGCSCKKINEEIEIIKNNLMETLMNGLFLRCSKNKISLYIDYLLLYFEKQIVVDEIIKYVFDKRVIEPKDAIYELKNSNLFVMKNKKIETIGMFYHRLNNGGVEKVISLLAFIWEKVGYKVVVITEQDKSIDDYSLPANTLRVVVGNDFINHLERAKRIRRILKDYKIDALVYHSWLGPDLLQDSITIKSEGIPLLIHTHSNFTVPFFDEYFYSNSLNMQHKIYCLSDTIITLSDVDNNWWNALGYKTKRVVNPPSYEISNVKVSSLENNNVLWVGRLSIEKQYEEMFKIAKNVAEHIKDVKFIVVGKCETENEQKKINKLINDYELNNVIRFEGFQKDVSNYYEKSSVYLSTSKFEGFSMAMIESKTYGLPMVAYNLDNCDFLKEDDGAIVVDQLDSDGAAREIIKLLENKLYRKQMGEKARNSVELMYKKDLSIVWKEIFEEIGTAEYGNKNETQSKMLINFMNAFESYLTNNNKSIIKTNEYDAQLDEVLHSTSWKIGRIITYIPRQAKDFIINMKSDGIKKAFNKLLFKFMNLKKTAKKLLE